jgi:hypothetical protein
MRSFRLDNFALLESRHFHRSMPALSPNTRDNRAIPVVNSTTMMPTTAALS